MLFSAKLKQLLRVLADGEFHSGSELAQILGVSRSAIWKQLQTFNQLGIELIAVSGKGYRLPEVLQLLDRQQIEGFLQPSAHALLRQLDIHDTLDSTNTYLLEQARLHAESGLVCITEHQTAGKGRRGRFWVSPYAQNIYLSLLWRYQDGPASIAGLSLALGVAVIKALQQMGLTDAGLKWPNDIYHQQRKLGGILVEVSGETDGPCYAVMGLGLNLFLSAPQAESINQPWTDIASALGAKVYQRRNELVALLLNQLLPVIAEFDTGNMAKYAGEWRTYDCMFGQPAHLYIAEHCYSGIVGGIDNDGFLLLETCEGQVRRFASGEVSFRVA